MKHSYNTRLVGWVLLLIVPLLLATLSMHWLVTSFHQKKTTSELTQFSNSHFDRLKEDTLGWSQKAAEIAASEELVGYMSKFRQYRLRQTQSALVTPTSAQLPTINLDAERPFQAFAEWLNAQRDLIDSGVRAIKIIGSDGSTLGQSSTTRWSPSDPSVVFRAMKQKSVSLDTLFATDDGQWIQPAITSIRDTKGNLLGAVITEFDVNETFQSVNAVETAAGNLHAVVLRPSGNGVVPLSEVRSNFQASPDLVALVAEPASGSAQINDPTGRYLLSVKPLGISDWVLMTRLDNQAESALASNLLTICLAALAITFALVAAGWWFVVRSFNKRLDAIAAASERMLKREFSVRINDRTKDTAGDIARHLDQIAGELNENITVKVAVKQRIKELADQDKLTGLYRAEYVDTALKEAEEGQIALPLTFAKIQVIDHDKLVETHSDSLGDEILVAVANRLKAVVEARHTLARRGSEFIVIAGDTDEAAATLMGTRINNAFTTSIETSVGEMLIGCQLTMATTGNRDTLARIFNGGESVDEDSSASTAETTAADAASAGQSKLIEEAIRDQRISVDYQPILRLQNGEMPKLEAAEALVRVHDTNGEVIPPNKLMPLIQHSASLLVLDRFMLTNTIASVTQWVEHNRVDENFRVSINLSRQSVQSSDIINFLRSSVIDQGLAPERIILEISGGTGDINVDILDDLRELGFTLALDDIGIRSANQSDLASMQPAYVKIDRRRLLDDEEPGINADMQQHLEHLKSSLGVEIVVKSVESGDQLARLAANGITLLQGYLFDKPRNDQAFVERWGQSAGESSDTSSSSTTADAPLRKAS